VNSAKIGSYTCKRPQDPYFLFHTPYNFLRDIGKSVNVNFVFPSSLGETSIDRKGSAKIPSETLIDESPLIRDEAKRTPRRGELSFL
jgi:hypothetical protein